MDTTNNVLPGERPEADDGRAVPRPRPALDPAFVQQLVDRARVEGVSLVGPDGLLAGLTKAVLEAALDGEITDHLGYEAHDAAGRNTGNSRNGTSAKRVHTDIGPVDLDIPRDRAGTFEPQLVPKHTRRLNGFDEGIISLYAKGLTTGEIQSHLAEMYGAEVSKETISKVTDAVNAELAEWQNRPLDTVYPVVFVDAIFIKIRDGSVVNRPVYVVMGVNMDGERDVLGLWIGHGGEGAKHWLTVLTELKNRGVADICILCCDGLTGLPDAVAATWPQTIVQTCVVHLVRATLRYVSRADWKAITPGMRAIYTAPTLDAASERFVEFSERWGGKYPAVLKVWQDAWEEFTPFLAFPADIRAVIYTTNAIESLNARFRRATRIRGHFPSEQAALKILYLTIREKRKGEAACNVIGRVRNWKEALNTFAIYFGDRITG